AAYLEDSDISAAKRANIAYSLGDTYIKNGQYEKALRWLYEAESWDDGELAEEIGPKIVHALERLGRHHAAQTALERRSGLGEGGERRRAPTDPVVARIGSREVTRSEVDRALDDLPPQLAQRFQGVEGRREFLRSYVAEELLWEKAQKLEYHDDPEVRRGHEQLLRQLAVARFVEREVLGKIEVDEDDLANFFAAHRERYAPPSKEGEESVPPTLEQVRPAVERDYRLMKTQSATAELIDSELAAAGVELFPERLTDAQ
ncbi:MAG: hypothetical protein R3325_07375, partial [Thermoanaerobaculia bacterium]|nr:hypothetical protein [Thermoanaerobaculia bacterium]